MANNKDMDIMRQLVDRKKAKSASQGSVRRGPQDRYGTSKPQRRKNREDGSPDVKDTVPEDEA